MKKLIALAIGLAFLAILPGCVYLDHPNTGPVPGHGCEDCSGYKPLGSRLMNLSMMTAGADPTPREQGEYFGSVANINTGAAACEYFGGGGPTLIHTYWNPAGGDAVGCQPAWTCYSGALLDWGWLWCPTDSRDQLCNSLNGDCDPPFWAGPYTQWPAGSIPSELYYISIDETPGSPGEGGQNLVRAPGALCPDCPAAMADDDADGVDAMNSKACEKAHKQLVCHIPPGNPENMHEICVGLSAVPAHEAHGDIIGPCDGGGPGPGGGLAVPEGNNAPAWSLGYMMYIDFTFDDLAEGLPWTDDYTSYSGSSVGEGQADLLTDLLRYHPTDEDGNIKFGVRQLTWHGDTIELNPPVVGYIKLQCTDKGLGHTGSMKADQPATPDLLRFVRKHTEHGQPVDFKSLQIVSNNGMVIDGYDAKRLLLPNADIAIGHERLTKAIADYEARILSAGANTRVRNIR